jgi:hypothetical protein
VGLLLRLRLLLLLLLRLRLRLLLRCFRQLLMLLVLTRWLRHTVYLCNCGEGYPGLESWLSGGAMLGFPRFPCCKENRPGGHCTVWDLKGVQQRGARTNSRRSKAGQTLLTCCDRLVLDQYGVAASLV